MAEFLGQKLLKANVIKEEQLNQAIERQRYHGVRLGHNLVALGFIKADELNTFLEAYPHAPRSIEQTGLDLSFIADLMLKHILFMGDFKLADLSEAIKLPVSILDAAIETLRRDKFVEIKGASEYARSTYNFTMTGQGKNRAGELLEICRYAGPAPVPLDDYRRMVEFQTIRNIVVDEGVVNKAFSHLTAFLNARLPEVRIYLWLSVPMPARLPP